MSLLRNLAWSLGIVLILFLLSWWVYMPTKAQRGIWQTEGYGLILSITPAAINVYQRTDVACHRDMRFPAHMGLVKLLEGAELSTSGDRLSLTVDGAVNPIMARRLDVIPVECTAPLIDTPAPQHVFDAFWAAMDEHYAFFDLHGVDWSARKTTLPNDATDQQLWDAITTAMNGLDDGHLYLAAPGLVEDGKAKVFSPSVRPSWHSERHMVRDTSRAQIEGGLTLIEGSGLAYGYASPDIGYVYLEHMEVSPGFGQRASTRAAAAIDSVLAALEDTRGIILDVRYNPGGSDDVALAYASAFAAQRTLAFSKTTRTATGYTDPFEVYIEPTSQPYLKPVVVLTTGYTGSAAEIFTMTMREFPQVTTIGSVTSGGLSDVLNFTLPNDWNLGLSHQIYSAADDKVYEGIGVPPDVDVAVDVAAFRSGQDPALAQAIALLSE